VAGWRWLLPLPELRQEMSFRQAISNKIESQRTE
jgi:hypothetical protein